uniref:RING-type E3 ubiquitin transferase n=1 Tax=Oryza punctata TaxID=4537 RepID=A0A0E0LA48_ORYPU
MALRLGEVVMIVVDVAFALCLLAAIICCCCNDDDQPGSQRDAQVGWVVMLRMVPPMVVQVPQAPQRAAALPYFRYAHGGASETTLVCAVCLEQLRHGELCSEVPACRHVFHMDCVGSWMKKSDSCPLCRVKIVPGHDGSNQLPVADMV